MRGTDFLETTERGTCQDTKRKQVSKGHSPTEGQIGGHKSGHRKEATKQGALTNWIPQKGAQVRIQKESD